MNKVFMLPADENWICDRIVDEWYTHNSDISVKNPSDANVIWLYSDWCWRKLNFNQLLKTKKVLTTIHHITPEKFSQLEYNEFMLRDSITDVYHVYNERTFDFVNNLTKKPIFLIKYWANQYLWQQTDSKSNLRKKYSLPKNHYLIGSFQRDTEGSDLKSPKLEKGPDLLVDFIERKWNDWYYTDLRVVSEPRKPHVLLSGWRRQYVIDRLNTSGIPYTYIERPSNEVINELYQTLDLYPVTSRYEGGPQSLIECGLLNVPVVSRPVGIAEQVLPLSAIHDDVYFATKAIPNVEQMKFPNSFMKYRELILSL